MGGSDRPAFFILSDASKTVNHLDKSFRGPRRLLNLRGNRPAGFPLRAVFIFFRQGGAEIHAALSFGHSSCYNWKKRRERAMENAEKGLLPIALDAIVLDCRDVAALSAFYMRLLGWERHYDGDDEWTEIVSPSGGAVIAFQLDEDYLPPVWPGEPGAQRQMAHLDFIVRDREQLALAVERAVSCGARKARVQYDPEHWTTMLDPDGHPFCFVAPH